MSEEKNKMSNFITKYEGAYNGYLIMANTYERFKEKCLATHSDRDRDGMVKTNEADFINKATPMFKL